MEDLYEENEKMLTQIDNKITLIIANLKMGGILDPENIILNSREIMQVLDLSRRTLQEWRYKNIIGFAKINGKFYYKLSDIQKLINDNYTPKK